LSDEVTTPRAATGGLEIIMQWAELPPEHLEVALKALEPQLAREHAYRMACNETERILDLERVRLSFEEGKEKRRHILYVYGLIAGFSISLASLAGATIAGLHNEPWLAGTLSGPSVIALASLFVLRRSDAAQTKAAADSQNSLLQAVLGTQVPSPVPQPPKAT
jgi:hypothetical protein